MTWLPAACRRRRLHILTLLCQYFAVGPLGCRLPTEISLEIIMKQFTRLAALIAMFAVGSLAIAQDDRAAQAKEQIAQTIERLDLSDEQIEQAKPILEDLRESRQAIMAKYGIDPDNRGGGNKPNPRQLRAMRTEIEGVQADANAKLRKILSAEQFKELEAIQQEGRDQMRERIRGAR
jgi:hypothetical protein